MLDFYTAVKGPLLQSCSLSFSVIRLYEVVSAPPPRALLDEKGKSKIE